MRNLEVISVTDVTESAAGGGIEGAERTTRETALWSPAMGSPDNIINRVKSVADARGRDMSNNDGYTRGAVGLTKDSIVGGHYRLNATPVVRVLSSASKGFDDVWQEEFQSVIEARFDLIAESEECWLDAAGRNTLTEQIRLAVGGDLLGGEILATAEWLDKDPTRPCKTAMQMVSPTRLSNPEGMPDTRNLRRGVVRDNRGKPIAYKIRMAHPGDWMDPDIYSWKHVAARKPWGRLQVLHLFEQQEPDQSRGIAEIVSVLKNMRMTKTFDELTLQQAVLNASYASAIESEMPPDAVYGAMGGGSGAENFDMAMGSWMSMLQQFFGASKNVAIDGVTVPVLPPGTKMVTKAIGTPGGLGSDFGEGLLRHTAAALGLSGEEFMNNFTKTNYSGLRAAINHTNKRMQSKKKRTADRYAGATYTLVLEEEIMSGNVPLPRGVSREIFYEPLMKQALAKSSWIGAGAGQTDELKETQAAMMRIKAGLSTWEREIAKLGYDWRDTFTQQARERKRQKEDDLDFVMDAQKPGNKERQNTMTDASTTKKEAA